MIKKYTLAPLMAALLISTTPVAQAGWFGDMWKKTKSTFTAIDPRFIPLALIGTVFAAKYAGYSTENLPSLVSALKSAQLPRMEFSGSHIAKLACKATIAGAVGLGATFKTTRVLVPVTSDYSNPSIVFSEASILLFGHKNGVTDPGLRGAIMRGAIGGAAGTVAGIATYKALNHYL